jgi:hypothetical protein
MLLWHPCDTGRLPHLKHWCQKRCLGSAIQIRPATFKCSLAESQCWQSHNEHRSLRVAVACGNSLHHRWTGGGETFCLHTKHGNKMIIESFVYCNNDCVQAQVGKNSFLLPNTFEASRGFETTINMYLWGILGAQFWPCSSVAHQ